MEPDPGRSQRVAAGVVGLAVFVGAIWLVATGGPFGRGPAPTPTPSPEPPVPAEPPTAIAQFGEPGTSERAGFIGLPPEGATPSTPERGELVLRYFGRQYAHWYQVWVYADGRLIWQREGSLLEGANERSTGFLEQRLSAEGLEMLLARGSAEAALFGSPWRPPYPASWLPARAWEDRTIRGYVPHRYAVCYMGLRRPIEPSRILRWLPEPAAEPLRAGVSDVRSDGGWLRGFGGGCSELSTEEARAVAEALEDAGFAQDEFQRWYGLIYYFEGRGSIRNEAVIRFEPILPHGKAGCSGCG